MARYRLNGRLGLTDAPDAADPVRIAGRVRAGAGLRRQCLGQLAGSRRPGGPDAERRDGRACPGQSRPVPLPHLARKPRLHRGLLRALHGRRRRDRPLRLRWDSLRRVRHRAGRPTSGTARWHHVAGTFDGRALRLFLDGQPVGEPMAAPLHIDYAQTVRAHHLRPVRRRMRTRLPRRHRPRAAVVRSPVPARRSPWSAAGSSVPRRPAGPRPAAAPGRVIPAGWTTPADPTASRPPARACVVRLLRASTSAKRRTVVRVRVTVRHRPLRATRVVARQPGRKKVLAKARTNATGRARLVLSSGRHRRVRISTQGRKRCGSVLRLPRRR